MFGQAFNKYSFIQAASELTTLDHFLSLSPASFQYEPKLNPNSDKNPEFQVGFKDYLFNIEVKCAHYEQEEKISGLPGIKMNFLGRNPERDALRKEMETLIKEISLKEKKPEELIQQKHYGLNALDFLKSAHNKFPDKTQENEANILIIATNCKMDEWNGHLIDDYQGLLTKQSHSDGNEYSKVYVVAISNLYHSHFLEKPYLNPFSLKRHFNVYHLSPFRRACKKGAIQFFDTIFPNFNLEIRNYLKEPPLGNSYANYIKKVLAIHNYHYNVLSELPTKYF